MHLAPSPCSLGSGWGALAAPSPALLGRWTFARSGSCGSVGSSRETARVVLTGVPLPRRGQRRWVPLWVWRGPGLGSRESGRGRSRKSKASGGSRGCARCRRRVPGIARDASAGSSGSGCLTGPRSRSFLSHGSDPIGGGERQGATCWCGLVVRVLRALWAFACSARMCPGLTTRKARTVPCWCALRFKVVIYHGLVRCGRVTR